MMEISAPGKPVQTEPSAPTVWVWGRPWTRWRSARLLLLFLWISALLLWSFTRLAGLLLPVEVLSAIVFVVLLWPWVRGPYLLYTRHSLPLRAGFEVRSTNFEAGDFKGSVELHKMGFEFASIVSANSVPGHRKVEAAIYVHPGNKDSAQLGRIATRVGPLNVMVFKTRFDDGSAFETSNSHTAPIFRPDPQFQVFRFPQIRSRADLYRIHQKLKERFAATRRPVITDKAEELAEFIARAEIVHLRNAERDYKLDAAKQRYVYTVRGAIRRAWLHTWPVKFIRQMQVERNAMKTATELGLRIHPIFGRLEDSLRRPDV